jgi:hypothetical protein
MLTRYFWIGILMAALNSSAAKFEIGNRVQANADHNGRPTPAGSPAETIAIGLIGVVFDGPTNVPLGNVTYTWYKVIWSDFRVKWSAQEFLNLAPAETLTPGGPSRPGPRVNALNPVFKWNPVPGAEAYGLYIRDVQSDTLVFPNSRGETEVRIQGTEFQPALFVLAPDREYKWNITTFRNGTEYISPSNPYSRWFFTPRDLSNPQIDVTTPSTGRLVTYASKVSFSGASSDDLGVKEVRWGTSDQRNGQAVGSTSWNTPEIDIPVGETIFAFVALDYSGKASVAETITVERRVIEPTIAIGPDALNFHQIQVGSCSELQFSITHVTGTPPAHGMIQVQSPFRLVDGDSFHLQDGQELIYRIQFCPTEVKHFNSLAILSTSARFQSLESTRDVLGTAKLFTFSRDR